MAAGGARRSAGKQGTVKIPPPLWNPTIKEYHRNAAISASMLKMYRTDREEFREILNERARGHFRERPEKASFTIGSCFGGHFLDKSEKARAWAKLNIENRAKVKAMIRALRRAEEGTWARIIHVYLTTTAGLPEWSYAWQHESGLWCRIRCDKLVGRDDDDVIINIELKTSRRDTPRGFRRDVEEFGYYNQIALQEEGLRHAFPSAAIESRWAFVSTTAPHRVLLLRPDPVKLADAAAENDRHLRELAGLNPLEPWGPIREDWEIVPPSSVPETA